MSRSEQGTLDIPLVRAIKQALADGVTPGEAASLFGKPYMVVYRIAIGETWKHVVVEGAEGDESGRLSPPRKVRLTPKLRELIYKMKRETQTSNLNIAKYYRVSESMVARAVRDARSLLAARVQRLLLTSGEHEVAMERYGLTMDEAEAMAAWAVEHELPDHLKAELAAED